MAAENLLSVEDYLALEEPPCVRYELSEGELLVSPSSSALHNNFRDGFHSRLSAWLEDHDLGLVTSGTDVKLVGETVRRPDVAFIRADRLRGIDLDRVPLSVAPDLVIEIVSTNDRADDLLLKVSQYVAAGAQAVWLFYPKSHVAYRYASGELEPEVRSADARHTFEEPELLPGFSIPLAEVIR